MVPLDWTKVESSTVSKIKFVPSHHDLNGDVLVEFKTGKKYRYKNVPFKHAEGMVHASSPYGYFKTHMSGVYDAEKLEEEIKDEVQNEKGI